MMLLLEPKEIEIEKRAYIISKFDCWTGREIITQYPISAIPKLGEYKSNEELVAKLMAYVAVPRGDSLEPLRLTTRELVRNHVPSWEILGKIEIAMIEYNCSFFQNGQALSLFQGFAQKLPALISKTLTLLSEHYSQAGKQPSKS